MATPTTVDEYIAAQTPQAQPRLHELRAMMRETVPQAVEAISYGMPAYHLRAGALYFAAAKRHCALYGAAVDEFPDEVRPYLGSKSTLRFPLDQPIPDALVRKIIARSVQVKESELRPE